MWLGASAAYEHSDPDGWFKDFVELVPENDKGSVEEAQKIAVRLCSNPRVLAVIGHASSGTTREAAPIYKKAGIPLLVPIATSPTAILEPLGETRQLESVNLSNCFRLPLSDTNGQAPAIAWFITQHLKLSSDQVYVVADHSQDAKDYSGPLADKVAEILDVAPDYRTIVNTATTDFEKFAEKLNTHRKSVVVFCGYNTTAKEYMDGMREVLRRKPSETKIKVLLTDGCKYSDIKAAPFEVYVTFPSPSVAEIAGAYPRHKGIGLLQQVIAENGSVETYEIFGYDAMMLVALAAKECKENGRLDRKAIIRQLSRPQGFRRGDTIMSYEFFGGENKKGKYVVFSCNDDAAGCKFTKVCEVGLDDFDRGWSE